MIDQSLSNIEIILLDDGSIDSAPNICDFYADADDRVLVVHKKNEGYSATVNLGLDIAKGEYIGIVESDDAVSTDMYATLYQRAKETDADIVKCGFYYCTNGERKEDGRINRIAQGKDVFEAREYPQIFNTHASVWAGIYKKSFLNENNIRMILTPMASYSDHSWMMTTLAMAHKISIIREPLYFYTYDNAASSHFKVGEIYKHILTHVEMTRKALEDAGIFEEAKEDAGLRCYTVCIDTAQKVEPQSRNDCFKRIYDIFANFYGDDFLFKRFNRRQIEVVKIVLNGDSEEFYDYLFSEFFLYNPGEFLGKNVAIFGAGKCGRSYEIQLRKLGVSVVGVFDNSLSTLVPSINPNEIDKYMFDYIIIAILDRKTAEMIKDQLISLGVPDGKIVWRTPLKAS